MLVNRESALMCTNKLATMNAVVFQYKCVDKTYACCVNKGIYTVQFVLIQAGVTTKFGKFERINADTFWLEDKILKLMIEEKCCLKSLLEKI